MKVNEKLATELKEQADWYFRRGNILLEAARILEGEPTEPVKAPGKPEVSTVDPFPIPKRKYTSARASLMKAGTLLKEKVPGKKNAPAKQAPPDKAPPLQPISKRDAVVAFLTHKGPACLGDIAKGVGSTNSRISVMLSHYKELFERDHEHLWSLKASPNGPRGGLAKVRQETQRLAMKTVGVGLDE